MERRQFPRRVPAPLEPLARVRVRTGRELTVVDISNGGILVEGPTRLLPGTFLEIHLPAPGGRVLVRSRVLRAAVHALTADTVQYRGALLFERPVPTAAAGYALPDVLSDAMPAGHGLPDGRTGEAAGRSGNTRELKALADPRTSGIRLDSMPTDRQAGLSSTEPNHWDPTSRWRQRR